MFVIFVSKSGCLHGISLGTISVIVSMDDARCTESMIRLVNGGVLDEKAENSLVWRIPSHLVVHARLFIYSEVFRNKARLAYLLEISIHKKSSAIRARLLGWPHLKL